MTYQEIIDYLEDQRESHDPEYIKKALDLVEIEIDPAKVIVVAGTNGKGTTSAVLQTLLAASGKNVGFYSSPHLENTTERIKFNCVDISRDDFCRVFYAVHEKISHLRLSHFEYLTVMAAYYFFEVHKGKIDYAVCEVGVGGTLDATNAIPHHICVITKLSMDHEDILGNTIIEIAKNKLGIIGDNCLVFHQKFIPEVKELSLQYAEKHSAKFIESYPYSLNVDSSGETPVFNVSTKVGDFKTSIPGDHAAENFVLALTIFDHLVENASCFLSTMEKVCWPGRMEKISYKNREIYLSGDHNPDGVRSLLQLLQYYKYEHIHFVVGIGYSKKHSEILELFIGVRDSSLYLTETPVHTLHVDEYDPQYVLKARSVSPLFWEVIDAAVENASENDLIVVSGSLYLIGDVKKHIKNI